MLFKRKCKITFIRHGATINTEENRFFDDENYPALNANGKDEMEKIAIWVKNKGLKIDRVFSSSALRCEQSARILASICNCDFEKIEQLTSRKVGVFSGLTFEDVEQQYPNKVAEFYKNPEEFIPAGGESILDFNKRIAEIISSIIEENQGKRLVVITHGSVIQAVVANALSIPSKDQFKVYIPTGSATQISYFEDFASLVYSAYIPI